MSMAGWRQSLGKKYCRDNGNRKMGLYKERHDKTSDMNGHCVVQYHEKRRSDQVALSDVGITWKNNGNCKSK